MSNHGWIMYTKQNIPGNQSFELDRARSLAHARDIYTEYCRGVGTDDCSATLFVCVNEEMWSDAEEFREIGCPFDYPDRIIERGPKGGVIVSTT